MGEQGRSETYSQANRAVIADELNGIRESIVNNANTTFGSRYLFAGTNTLTQPFDFAGTYFGNNDAITLQVDQSFTVDINIPGDDLIYGGTGHWWSAEDMLDAIADLAADLVADNSTGN